MSDKNKIDTESKNENSNYWNDDTEFFEIEEMLSDLMCDVKNNIDSV